MDSLAKQLSPLSINEARIWDTAWDCRTDKEVKTKHHVFYIRHGQYVNDDPKEKEEFSPEEDFLNNDVLRPLTELGREQSHLTGQRVADILEHEGLLDAVRVYSSDMVRAKETASIIHSLLLKKKDEIPIYVDSVLREGAPIKAAATYAPWEPEEFELYEDGCRIESAFRKFVHRVDLAQEKPIRRYVEKDGVFHTVDIIVCHGNLIRYSFLRALQLPSNAWLQFGVFNASITRLMVTNSGWVGCSAVGDTCAIPVSKVTNG
jgi:serine/threonine-protein phosphatase PGAM5